MKRIFFLFVFILISSAGCKKEYPVSSTGTPVFYFNGAVNGLPVNIQAGVNNYYMYSSFSQDSNNVYRFLGELKQNNCTNCNNKIKFQINDDTSSVINGSSHINISLLPGYYALQGGDSTATGIPSPTAYKVNFIANPSDSVESYLWDFGDGTSYSNTEPFPFHTYKHPGYYSVCLKITYTNTCVSSICNQIKIGVPDAACSVYIGDSVISANTISFSAIGTGTSSTYLWDFGDGTTSSAAVVSHSYSNPGVYKVCLQTVDQNNCISNTCKNVSTANFQGCVTNFNFSIQGTNPNPLAFSNVIVSWTDNSGILYTSNSGYQSNDSYFQIVSVESHSNNENNQPTKKLHVKFKCRLYNGGNYKQINNGDAVIAVSYR